MCPHVHKMVQRTITGPPLYITDHLDLSLWNFSCLIPSPTPPTTTALFSLPPPTRTVAISQDTFLPVTSMYTFYTMKAAWRVTDHKPKVSSCSLDRSLMSMLLSTIS